MKRSATHHTLYLALCPDGLTELRVLKLTRHVHEAGPLALD